MGLYACQAKPSKVDNISWFVSCIWFHYQSRWFSVNDCRLTENIFPAACIHGLGARMNKTHTGTAIASGLSAGICPEIFSCLIFASSALQAEELADIDVVENGGAYQIKVVAIIKAPASYVRGVLTDYTHIYRLNPSIIESEVLQRHADGAVSVRTRVIGCAAYFCEELERVEKVQQLPSGDLQAEIIPEHSQFSSGKTLWQIKNMGEYCEVTYHSEVVPDIFIPPVVGKFLVKKSIKEEMKVSFANLEKISSVMAEREWHQDYMLMDDERLAMSPPAVSVDLPCRDNQATYLSDISRH
jgi:hypothetical protein